MIVFWRGAPAGRFYSIVWKDSGVGMFLEYLIVLKAEHFFINFKFSDFCTFIFKFIEQIVNIFLILAEGS